MSTTKPEPAIEVKNIHKEFVLPQSKTTSLKQAAVNIVRDNKKTTQKVLDGISFTINKGDFFGIVGRNGSGKSTLLKMIAGVYTPTVGEITIHGGLTPFIELGVGFNPELSGRDNVYLNGALLGYTHKQMDEMYEEIVDFAELGPFMDQKLKNYSSGMQVRLAFSIAIKAKNDILIFDEVLAVGDEAFQRKCMDVFRNYKENKQTVVLVTHSMDNVVTLCNRALMLENGKIVTIGDVNEVAEAYQKSNLPIDGKKKKDSTNDAEKKIITISGNRQGYKMGDKLKIALSWPSDLEVAWAGVSLSSINNVYLFGTNTGMTKMMENSIEYEVELSLGPGDYFLNAAIKNLKGDLIEAYNKICTFTVYSDYEPKADGLIRLKYEYTSPKKESNS